MSEKLFAEFESATPEQWVDAVRESLRGKPVESLVRTTYEGIDIQPLPHADDLAGITHHHSMPGQFPYVRGATAAGYRAAPWLIAQQLDLSDPREFNLALKDALANGQTAILLGDSPALRDAEDVRLALAGIDLQSYPLFVHSPRIYDMLCAALSAGELKQLHGCAGYDPLGNLARTGAMPADAFDRMAAHVQAVNERSPLLGSIAVSTAPYHDAGANAVQELALAIATGVTTLRELNRRGLAPSEIAPKLHFFFNIGENFFMEVAKFRAIKSLWAQVIRAFDVDGEAQKIILHARSGNRNKSRLDVHVNMLRLTTEALAAAIGGVDSIQLSPFDQPLGSSNDFSRRLARNLQLILQVELQLIQLIDPAGGAWHVEKLTDQLARAAWSLFQTIEADGGMLACLQTGFIQTQIESVAEERKRDMELVDAILVGSNKYIDSDADLLAIPPPPSGENADAGEETVSVWRLKPLRLAEPFESTEQRSGMKS